MAIIKCPHCGENVSSTTNTCIHCGGKFTFCLECGEVNVGEKSVCAKCGNPLTIKEEVSELKVKKVVNEDVDLNKEWKNNKLNNVFTYAWYVKTNKMFILPLTLLLIATFVWFLIKVSKVSSEGLEYLEESMNICSNFSLIWVFTSIILGIRKYFPKIGNVIKGESALKLNYGCKNFVINTVNDIFELNNGKYKGEIIVEEKRKNKILKKKSLDVECGLYIYSNVANRIIYIISILLGIIRLFLCSFFVREFFLDNVYGLILQDVLPDIPFTFVSKYLIAVVIVLIITLVSQYVLKNIYSNKALPMLKEYVGDKAQSVFEILN